MPSISHYTVIEWATEDGIDMSKVLCRGKSKCSCGRSYGMCAARVTVLEDVCISRGVDPRGIVAHGGWGYASNIDERLAEVRGDNAITSPSQEV